MPGPLGVEFEGAIHHPTSRTATAGQASCLRGDRREPIFRDDANRRRFLDTLSEPCAKTDWQKKSGKAKAGRWVREKIARQGWREANLGRLRQTDPGKVRIARRLRAETTMTLACIAQRLQMGIGTHGSNLLVFRTSKKRDVSGEGRTLCQ